ncbi:hypothetical protein GCM10023318_06070 [Nocardia callitridis]|uniref:Uncharacterized protein n=1 Tax=Nocardia callitridis TaxID=648753 RepID=A0ABP9JWG4_9NOCA
MVGIDRHIRATGLQHGMHADDQLQRTPHPQRHQRFRADTVGDQVPGQPVDPSVELRVGERRALEIERDPLRRHRGLRVQQRGQRGVGYFVLGVVPLHQRARALVARDEIEIPHRLVGVVGEEAREEFEEAFVMTPRLVLAVEVRVGLEVDVGTGALDRLVEVDAEILDAAGGQHVHLADRRAEDDLVLEQHDVDPRTEELGGDHTIARGVAADVLVPVTLMTQRARHFQRRLLHQIGDGRVVPDVQPQRHDIRGNTTGAAHLRGGTRGDRQAEDDVFETAILREIGAERGEQEHGGRGVVALDGGFQQRVLRLGQRGAGESVDRGGRRRTAGEGGALLQPDDALGPVLLVGSEAAAVAVGDFLVVERAQLGRFRRWLLFALVPGRVDIGAALEHGRRAETVGDDVVTTGVPVAMGVGELKHGADRQTIGQHVQRLAVLRAHPGHRGGLGIGVVAEVYEVDPIVLDDLVVHALHRLAVALDDAQQTGAHLGRGLDVGLVQQFEIELALELDVHRDSDRHLRVEVLRVPDAQLRRRQRKVVRSSLCPFATSFAVSAEIQPVQP